MSPRRKIRPHEAGRRPCTSPEGRLVNYSIMLPPSLKAWCMEKGPARVRALLELYRGPEDGSKPLRYLP